MASSSGGYDISASLSQSNPAATGASKFGNVFIGSGVGGSSGFSLQTVLVVAVVAVLAWFFLIRRRK